MSYYYHGSFLEEMKEVWGLRPCLQPTCSLPPCWSQVPLGGAFIQLLPDEQTWLTYPESRHLRSCFPSFSFNFHYINFTFPGIKILSGWTHLEIKSAKTSFILMGLLGGRDKDGWWRLPAELLLAELSDAALEEQILLGSVGTVFIM